MSDAFWMSFFAFLTTLVGLLVNNKKMNTLKTQQNDTHILVNGARLKLEADLKAATEENFKLKRQQEIKAP